MSLEDWKDSIPIFVLELTWGGITYYLSSRPIEVQSNNNTISFEGGLLEDPEYIQEFQMGFNVDSISISVAAILPRVNISEQIWQGNYMENAKGELAMLLYKNGEVISYDRRIHLVKGFVTQPVFGHADKPDGYVEFSIESKVFDSSLYAFLTGSSARCNADDISALDVPLSNPFSSVLDAFGRIQIFPAHMGKQIPFVFGSPGGTLNQNSTSIRYASTPAYCVASDSGTSEVYLLIAAHPIKATKIMLWDDKGHFKPNVTVSQFVMRNGNIFSYVVYDTNAFAAPLVSLLTDASIQYWVSWQEGSYISPLVNTTMEGGGDICLWCLTQGNSNVDYKAWESIREYLNRYIFAGYIKASQETPIEFLDKNILPFLPISVVMGQEGLKPQVNLLNEGVPVIVRHKITADEEFFRISPITTITDANDIVNGYTLEYAFDGARESYRSVMRCKPSQSYYGGYQFTNLYAELSHQRFGLRERIEQADYIHDMETAALICKDKIKALSTPKREVVYLASPRYGYVELGDVIELTDESMNLGRRKAQIVKKLWQYTNWEFTLHINDNLIQDIEQ